MNSRSYTVGIVVFSIVALACNWVGTTYANFQFDCHAVAEFESGCRFSLQEYVLGHTKKSLLLFEGAFSICVYLPPVIAAVKLRDWVAFQKLTFAIALVLAIVSMLQMLSWEVSSQSGCTGCLLPFLAQIVFDFFVFVAAVYRNVFYQVSKD